MLILSNIEQYWAIYSNIEQYRAILSNIEQYWAILSYIKQYWAILSNIEQYRAILSNIEQYWVILSNIEQYRAILSNIEQYLEAYSGKFLGLGPEMLRMSLLGPILARFWAWGQKCSKLASWDLFWSGSWPRARNAQHEPPGAYSGQVLSLGPEMLEMSLLGPILARFWA